MTNDRPLGRGLGSLIPKKSSVAPPSTPPPLGPSSRAEAGSVPTPPSRSWPETSPPARAADFAPPGSSRPAPLPDRTVPAAPDEAPARQRLFDIPVHLIDPNPHQPRHRVHDDSLDELVDSIRQHGILQPVIVTRAGERYQLIAGERRLRAAARLGLAAVPAMIRESRELERLELAIVENVQRQDLNPIEAAQAYQQLSEGFGLTQDEIARKVGKRRTTIANAQRLLGLPPAMQQALRDGQLTASHAKILLTAVTPQDRQRLFQQILDGRLPVRAAAQLGQQTTVRRHVRRSSDPEIRAREDELRTRFGTKVKITKRDQRGSISIEFYSDEEFHHLLNRLR